MKIVHIANFYGPKSGGIRTTLHELGKGYTEKGHHFTYIVPGNGFFREETPEGIRITMPSIPVPFSGGYRIIRSNRALRDLLITLHPDQIEVSDRFTLTSIGKWATQRKIPAVVFSHETLRGLLATYIPSTRISNYLADKHNRFLSNCFENIIATTDFASKEFLDLGISNLVKIPLGVDLKNFSPKLRTENMHAELAQGADLVLIHCGRLSPEKKPQRSLEALKILHDRGLSVRLVYLGTGPMHEQLMRSAKGYPVTFRGFVANRTLVAEILASADISLAPGPIETFCLAALESLASGVPVVTSETNAVREFLNINSAEPLGAIAANNGKSFADAIERVLELKKCDPELAEKCFHQSENFPWSSTIGLMLRLHGERFVGARSIHRLKVA